VRCPFLREAQVKSCRASAYRKLITRGLGTQEPERCSSSDYVNCPAAKLHHEERPSLDHCPFLQESLVQYCSAAPVTTYIPYSESALSACGSGSHRYCELYHTIAAPENMPAEVQQDEPLVEGMKVPLSLWYSPNHLWLDAGPEETVHVGIDAFLATVLSSVDSLAFVTTKGLNYPTVVLSVHGVDLQIVFPHQILITRHNAYLRTNPSKLLTHPYSLGWLFEGTAPRQGASGTPSPILDGLVSGTDAVEWMRSEHRRMSALAHEFTARPDRNGHLMMADGGTFSPTLFAELTRDQILHVFNEFFSPFARRRSPK
jgi:glycine cleavage system H lipoate-binding protein